MAPYSVTFKSSGFALCVINSPPLPCLCGCHQIYEEVSDLTKLKPVIEEYLADYNAESKQPMALVMFLDAIEHVSRIARVLRQPQVGLRPPTLHPTV